MAWAASLETRTSRVRPEQPGADALAVPRRVDGDGGDVAVAGDEHQAGVAHDCRADLGDDVDAGGAQGQLGQEQSQRPRPRVHLALDLEHAPEVATLHGHQLHVEPVEIDRLGGHQRVCQLISASALRR
jgi:hypothetical protein